MRREGLSMIPKKRKKNSKKNYELESEELEELGIFEDDKNDEEYDEKDSWGDYC
jgi:hypothetical protein